MQTLLRGLSPLRRIATFCAFVLIPFLGGNDLPLFFVTIDRFWIETTFILSLIVALFALFLAGGGPDKRFGRFLVFASPLAAVCAISLVYTWNRLSTLNEINLFVWSFGAVFLYLSADDRDEVHEALIVGSLFMVLAAVIQLKFVFPSLTHAFTGGKYGQIVREQIAPFGSFLNQNMLGGYFLYTLPLAIYFALLKRRSMYLIAVAALSLGIFLSLSRLAMLLGCAGAVAACLMIGRANVKQILKLACCCGCAVIIFAVLLHGEKREGSSTMRSLLGEKIERVSTEIQTLDKRTNIWGHSYRAFLAKPFAGYGAGTFEYAYRKFYDGGLYTKYAHGSLAKTAVELGSVGLLAFLFYLAAFARGIVRERREWSSKCIALSAASGILLGFVDFTFDVPAHVVTFFVLTSVFVAQRKSSGPMTARKPLLLFLIVLLSVSFLFTTRVDLSRKLIDDGTFAEESGLFDRAYRSYTEAIDTMPFNNDGYIRSIAILLKSYDNEKDPQKKEKIKLALSSYMQEVEQSSDRDSELYFLRAMYRSAIAPGKGACALGLEAISLYPSSGHYIFETARCYAGWAILTKR